MSALNYNSLIMKGMKLIKITLLHHLFEKKYLILSVLQEKNGGPYIRYVAQARVTSEGTPTPAPEWLLVSSRISCSCSCFYRVPKKSSGNTAIRHTSCSCSLWDQSAESFELTNQELHPIILRVTGYLKDIIEP